MRTIWLGAVFFAATSAAYGQLDDNTFTITASRTIDLQPDQAIVGVYVDSPADNGVDDIVGALQGSGITAANLTGIYSSGYLGPVPRTDWTFSLPVPFSKLKDTLAALAEVQRKNSGPAIRGNGKASLDVSFG